MSIPLTQHVQTIREIEASISILDHKLSEAQKAAAREHCPYQIGELLDLGPWSGDFRRAQIDDVKAEIVSISLAYGYQGDLCWKFTTIQRGSAGLERVFVYRRVDHQLKINEEASSHDL